jgi:hypothetical protein
VSGGGHCENMAAGPLAAALWESFSCSERLENGLDLGGPSRSKGHLHTDRVEASAPHGDPSTWGPTGLRTDPGKSQEGRDTRFGDRGTSVR